ncbi:MAG: hypothetical protein ACRDH9_10840 [Actinomycetota bacterium]
MRARSTLVIVSLVALGLGATATSARASFHFMKVREVYAGSLLEAKADFVELQMYSVGQTVVSGKKLTLYDQAGKSRVCTIPQNVANGANQETILFATMEAQTAFGVNPDFLIPDFLSGAGGAVCFESPDCVSWGSFSGTTTSPAGTPKAGGITVGESIDRRTNISGDPSMLEAADDTDNSANDFEGEAPSPNPNGPLTLGTATCTAAGGGGTDTDEPSSKITAPKHRTAITTNDSTDFQGTAKDQGGEVARVDIALRQKISGGCKWWKGNKFVRGACAQKVFVAADGTKKWSYDLPRALKTTGDKIRNYILYSRATDVAGNVESEFLPGANKSKFEVFKPPIVCAPQPC